ncbi:MAG: cupredoxin domain-containing protein, partial [Armatimonadetes bacterium]|nr:cupredoxin domain-containing protein [Armatimonadota bacterium]
YWTPAIIVVNAGDTVILKVTNGDPNSPHGFSLAAFNISAPTIAPGKSETFRFRAMRPGIYHYGCGLTGCASDHADQVGQLVVLGK